MAELNLQDVDLYELLGIASTSSSSEVKKAYRKKALTCHPDKNPDNPRAAELFHQLSKALEILIDESARAAYDKVLNGKKAAKLRHRELDEKRKKLKEDLEARERTAAEANAANKTIDTKTDEEKLQAEIERLRKEGSRQVEEEVELVRQQLLQDVKVSATEQPQTNGLNRLRIKWKASKDDPNNGGYPYETLLKIMSKYGDIVALVVSPKKNGSALVEFKTKDATDTAFSLEKGFLSNPLTMERLGESSKASSQENETAQIPKQADPSNSDDVRNNIPSATLFPNLTQPASHISGVMPSFASAPDFSQLLYANYLGQHLRYQQSMPMHTPSVAQAQAHPYQTQHAQMVMTGPGAGTVLMPGHGMSNVAALMGYGHVPGMQGMQSLQGLQSLQNLQNLQNMQSMQYPGYSNHLIGLPSYHGYGGWPLSSHSGHGGHGAHSALNGVLNGTLNGTLNGSVGHASHASQRAAAASYAAGLPVLRSQMPTMANVSAAFPSMATGATVYFPQLLNGLPAVIPR